MASDGPQRWYPFRPWCKAKGFTVQTGYNLISAGKVHTVTAGRRRYVTESEDKRFDKASAKGGVL